MDYRPRQHRADPGMDHLAAASALRKLSRGLTDAADHLDGMELARRALFSAGDAAEELARVHGGYGTGALARDYVGDLLDTPAREVVSGDSTRRGYRITTHEPGCTHAGRFDLPSLKAGERCPGCGGLCEHHEDDRGGRSVDRPCVIHAAAPCEGGCPGR